MTVNLNGGASHDEGAQPAAHHSAEAHGTALNGNGVAQLESEAHPPDEARAAAGLRRRRRSQPEPDPSTEIDTLFAITMSLLKERSQLVLHVVAATHAEGTSTIASALARRAAQEPWCRTILLDAANAQTPAYASPRLPSPERKSLPPAVQQPTTKGDLVVIPVEGGSGGLWTAALAANSGTGVARSVDEFYGYLREQFTLTIVDCPPIIENPHLASLAHFADGVILVVEAERTRVRVIERARSLIEMAGGNVLGVVLNKRPDYIPQFLYRFL